MISPTPDSFSPADDVFRKAAESRALETPRWQLVGTFGTLESAEAAMRRLEENHIESSICMINGLSVIARR